MNTQVNGRAALLSPGDGFGTKCTLEVGRQERCHFFNNLNALTK